MCRLWRDRPWKSLRRMTSTLTTAQKINETLKKASACLFRLKGALTQSDSETEDLTEQVKEIFRGRESQISELEQINIELDHVGSIYLTRKMPSTMILIESFPRFLALTTTLTSILLSLSPLAALEKYCAMVILKDRGVDAYKSC